MEEEVGLGREGSMPPAHGLRTEGGEGARRRRLQRSINVGGQMTTTTGSHRHRRHRQRSPGLVPTIGREVVAGGSDVNVGGGGGSGGARTA